MNGFSFAERGHGPRVEWEGQCVGVVLEMIICWRCGLGAHEAGTKRSVDRDRCYAWFQLPNRING